MASQVSDDAVNLARLRKMRGAWMRTARRNRKFGAPLTAAWNVSKAREFNRAIVDVRIRALEAASGDAATAAER